MKRSEVKRSKEEKKEVRAAFYSLNVKTERLFRDNSGFK